MSSTQSTLIPTRAEHRSPGPLVRLLAWLQRGRLIDELARGLDPAGSPAREACAARLARPRHRARLADAIDRIIEDSTSPAPVGARLSSAIPLDWREVRLARPALIQLADRLRDPADVDPRGAAMVEQMLRDGGSCLYEHLYDGDVDAEARKARAALGSGWY